MENTGTEMETHKTIGAEFRPLDKVRIGHVHLKVADLERALGFYCGVLGFELMQQFGNSAAFISAGGYHHHIGLNTWESAGGAPPPPGTTGLYHLAILFPTRASLAEALRRLLAAGIELDGASDHGVSEALYVRDPDGNGVELYWDRPPNLWPRTSDDRQCTRAGSICTVCLLKTELSRAQIRYQSSVPDLRISAELSKRFAKSKIKVR
jgi:catechol 2,3-dioxygenase